jgi:DNA-binding response OmpR family regulator
MEHILIIEDNIPIRENLIEILEMAGYNVLIAANGSEGVCLAREKAPGIILCDILMPELDGYGVFRELKANVSTANTPFVFVTASAEKSEVTKGLEMGAWGYISKPFDPMELLQTVKDCLEGKMSGNKAYAG